MACMVRGFTSISLLSVGILSNPFNWRKVLSGAKGCHLFGLISDKSAEKSEGENLNFGQFSILAMANIAFLFVFAHMQMSCDVTSSRKIPCGRQPVWRIFQIFEYLDLNYSALLAD